MTELGSPKPGVVCRNAAGNHPEFSKPDLPAQKPPAQGAKSSLKKPSSRKNRSPAPCCRCSAKLKQKNRFLTSGLPGLWFAFLVVSAAGSFSAEQFVATEISQAPDLLLYTLQEAPLGGSFATLVALPSSLPSQHRQACLYTGTRPPATLSGLLFSAQTHSWEPSTSLPLQSLDPMGGNVNRRKTKRDPSALQNNQILIWSQVYL